MDVRAEKVKDQWMRLKVLRWWYEDAGNEDEEDDEYQKMGSR